MGMSLEKALNILCGAEVMVLNRNHDQFMAASAVAMNNLKETIREKAEREAPRPLTVNELLHMHGEPVYLTVPGKPHRNKWCIVDLETPRPGLLGKDYFCDLILVDTNAVKVFRHKPKEDPLSTSPEFQRNYLGKWHFGEEEE